MRWRSAAGSSAALLLLAASAAGGATAGFLSPSAGDRLLPGATVPVAWTLDPSVLQGKDEMELVLSLDDGASFPVRVTGRIEVEDRSGSWRVPALSSRSARLALRAGDDEDGGSETLLFVSDRFSIEDPDSSHPEGLYPVGEELRTGEALEGAPVRESPGAIEPGRTETLRQAGPEAPSLEERTPVSAPEPERLAYRRAGERPVWQEPKGPARFFRTDTPLRV